MNDGLSRGEFIGASTAAGASTLTSRATAVAATGRTVPLKMRWYGGGVYELATPDDATIVLVDAWIWNNTGFKSFGLEKPPEFASAAAYAAHVKARGPQTFLVAVTHDHADHLGDYFELLSALVAAGIDVKTVGQSDLMRVALVPKFKAANLDNTALVVNNGQGINMGGTVTHKSVKLELVPAIHSTFAGYPAAGYIIDIGGARVYASGDTDLYGDIALLGMRYKPDLAVVSAGNGFATMGPDDAAYACTLAGVSQAVPVHYGHNPLVLGPPAGDQFAAALARTAPGVKATVVKPGVSTMLQIARNAARV